jgi:hypothetical protein
MTERRDLFERPARQHLAKQMLDESHLKCMIEVTPAQRTDAAA